MGGCSSCPIWQWQIDLPALQNVIDIPSSRSLETFFNLENPSKMAFFDHYFCSTAQNTESTRKYELLQLSLDMGPDNLASRRVSGRAHRCAS